MPRKPSPAWFALEWITRLPVCALFIYTGRTKLQDLANFVKETQAYQLLPHVWDQWSYPLAYVLPWLELLTAILLLVGLWRREARFLLALMLVGFTAGKTYVLVIGRNIDCGCVPTDSFLHHLFDGWIGVATNIGLLCLLGLELIAVWRRRSARRAATTEDLPAAAAAAPESHAADSRTRSPRQSDPD